MVYISKKGIVTGSIIAIISLLIACEKLMPKAPADDSILDGPVEGLTPEQSVQFLRGDVAFNDEVFTPETGLGPLFVATSCGTCHAGDGKGHPFTTLTRFGQTDSTGNKFLDAGGPQLQHRAIYNYQPEQIPAGATFSKFMPPANTGLGFLDAVTDADLLALADPQDLNGDGISGKPNWITIPDYLAIRANAAIQNGKYIGRFGKKAAAYDLLHQTVNAYNQDMGIASAYEPYDTYNHQEVDPEVSNQTVIDVVVYLKTLKAPIQRTPGNPDVQAGKKLFTQIGCAKCHIPEMKTGASSINALSNKTFAPYTDLLLHDMGTGLDDGYTEGTATTAEWRTPPLWGLGLSRNSQGGQYFLLHDGRAKSIEEAILLHGGEAHQSKDHFQQLSAADKARLIKFLESL
ncbi:c-type cytochrome [Pseudoflavitalea sp. X16]|uniref:di-heme oxidoredictase family protein n=1 Tax=Paraflavitalea devenefica TaxID=2716334 RepID=UPI00142361A0|nr:di-heme oxidoredictase family protein [Paraflavitalea devenefica]NII26007.1 c-type cytochrome [Paraflavitalea devenefica]